MIHPPKTVLGYVLSFLIALGLSLIVVSFTGSRSGTWLWASIGVIALMCIVVAVFARRHSDEAARERAWAGSFSFADAVAAMRAREAPQASR